MGVNNRNDPQCRAKAVSVHFARELHHIELERVATKLLGVGQSPASTKHLYKIYTTPAQRLRRWSSIV